MLKPLVTRIPQIIAVPLKLHPNEFMGMVEFLYNRVTPLLAIEPTSRSIYDQVLIEYWQKARLMEKVPLWRMRNSRQRYSHKMPVSVIRILHQEMQHVELTIFGQAFLARLDQHLINELSNPYARTR